MAATPSPVRSWRREGACKQLLPVLPAWGFVSRWDPLAELGALTVVGSCVRLGIPTGAMGVLF